MIPLESVIRSYKFCRIYYKPDTLSPVLSWRRRFDNRCPESLQNPVNKLHFLITWNHIMVYRRTLVLFASNRTSIENSHTLKCESGSHQASGSFPAGSSPNHDLMIIKSKRRAEILHDLAGEWIEPRRTRTPMKRLEAHQKRNYQVLVQRLNEQIWFEERK